MNLRILFAYAPCDSLTRLIKKSKSSFELCVSDIWIFMKRAGLKPSIYNFI